MDNAKEAHDSGRSRSKLWWWIQESILMLKTTWIKPTHTYTHMQNQTSQHAVDSLLEKLCCGLALFRHWAQWGPYTTHICIQIWTRTISQATILWTATNGQLDNAINSNFVANLKYYFNFHSNASTVDMKEQQYQCILIWTLSAFFSFEQRLFKLYFFIKYLITTCCGIWLL